MVRYRDQLCPEKLVDLFIDLALADDTQDRTGRTALYEAVTHNASLRIVKNLLQEDLNLDIMDNDDNTPLHLAAETLNTEVTKLLLQCGQNVNSRTMNGDIRHDKAAGLGFRGAASQPYSH
ncbi:hypothetical protein L873DRAFT_474825 [Choiromyces venosus 120613-1]|uniref:Uncharacterized protein n=1 Tax=Choiromyces venosus 120613-1 TaxID=1336337 RepID=A0A3N4IYY7_9PEZI|nr:hypothetical protein L873DRAFT_474825 [Choiromyces venosus 120613-1]